MDRTGKQFPGFSLPRTFFELNHTFYCSCLSCQENMLQVLLQVLCRLVRFSLQTGITFWFTIITIILNSPFQPPSLRNRNGGCFYLSTAAIPHALFSFFAFFQIIFFSLTSVTPDEPVHSLSPLPGFCSIRHACVTLNNY